MSAAHPPERPDEEDDLEALARAEAELAAAPPRDEPEFVSAADLMAARAANEARTTAVSGAAGDEGGGRRWLLRLALVGLVFLAFAPVLGAGFVNWDDNRNFVENTQWRGLSASNLAWMFTSYHMAHWHPLTWISLAVDHTLFGLGPDGKDAHGLHVMNVVWHSLGALAAFACARLLFRAAAKDAPALTIDLAAFFASALFAIHPLRAESVAWVTERRDVLSGFFVLLALRSWLVYATTDDAGKRRGAWIWSLLWFVAAGMSKVAVFVLPFVLVVLDLWPLRRSAALGFGRLLVEKLAHFAVAFALMGVALYGQRDAAGAMYSMQEHPLSARLAQAGFATFFYPMKTLKPTALSPMYELPAREEMFGPAILGPASIGLVVALVALLLFRFRPAVAAAWACFLITIAPVSGLTQAGSQLVADRYSYLACIPFAFLVGGALFLALRGGRASPQVGAAVGAVLLAASLFATRAQASVWRDSVSLWSQARDASPSSAIAWDKLGEAVRERALQQHDPKTQAALLRDAINSVGRAYELGRDPKYRVHRVEMIRRLADLEPEQFDKHAADAMTELEAAFAEAKERALEIKPEWRAMRANLLIDGGKFQEAWNELKTLLAQDPQNVEGHYLSGLLLSENGKAQDALPHLGIARDQNPGDVRVWASLGKSLAELGRKDEAVQALQRVIALQTAALGPAGAAQDGHVQFARDLLAKLGVK
ncbi:MAG: tetratricopeptide repeat protein [Planctomycetota bacterium]